jgi:imidazolonepropionase-like amidohydrolase
MVTDPGGLKKARQMRIGNRRFEGGQIERTVGTVDTGGTAVLLHAQAWGRVGEGVHMPSFLMRYRRVLW